MTYQDWIQEQIGKRFYGWDGATYKCTAHNDRGFVMVPEIAEGNEPERSLTERAIGGTFFEIAEDGRVKGLRGAPNCKDPLPLTRPNFQAAVKARIESGLPAI